MVFFCFGITANSMFGGDELYGESFGTLEQTFNTQLSILLGEPPESYDQDMQMIVYVVLVFVILFFLMLNFLLAIVIDGMVGCIA